jgi:regulator of chromosome condensation
MKDATGNVVPFAERTEAVITQVVAGGNTQSIALSATGDVYTWGALRDSDSRKFRSMPPLDDNRTPTGYKDMNNLEEDEDPQLYHPPLGKQEWPLQVIDIPGRVKDVSAGNEFIVALLEDDSIVTWGLGQCGELARPVPKLGKETSNDIVIRDFLKPQVPVWEGPMMKHTVVTVACGGFHLLVVTRDSGGPLDVYSSGLNLNGQLGYGDTRNREVLTKIQSLAGQDIVKVEGGLFFSCFVDKTSKKLYACGRGDCGQLGTTLEQPERAYHESLPVRVPLVHEPDV